MARKPKLQVVEAVTDFSDLSEDASDALFDPLFDDELAVEDAVFTGSREEYGIDLEDAVSELSELIDSAVEFMNSEMVPAWEEAEQFYDGETSLPIIADRSRATETVFRDAVRSVKPSVMRVFTQYPQIAEFKAADPMDFALGAVAEAQTRFANNLFWNNGGYTVLLDATHNTLVKRSGILKSHRKTKVAEEFYILSNVPPEGVQQLQQFPEVTIIDVQPEDEGGVTGLLHVELAYRREGAENRLDSVDMTTFFVDDHATTPENARVIGERTSITVGEAIAMGLDYDEWKELDDYDAGLDVANEEETTRRGVQKQPSSDTVDLGNHRFLLTEVYARFDLDGTGIPQLYKFFLGGTDYVYLAHDRVEENPYSVCNGDPLPNSFFGRSFMDVLGEDQNVQTSLLRAAVDNAHQANNKRLAVHDTLVNMADVMNNAVGAPIRFRQPGMIQEIGVSSTLGTLLPLMQYLRAQSEIKAGITNAAMGLDPDAMQSTDKEAVRNTIQLAQGQVELFCRNMAETGIRSAMMKLLRLSLRHPAKDQPLPMIFQLFDPNAQMVVSIGLGTGNLEGRIAALQQVIAQQKEVIAQYGISNPICSVNHMLRSMVDLGTLMGVPNMGRYFESLTPEMVQQLQQMVEQQQQAAAPEPPSVAIALAEEIRGKARMAERQMENEQKTADRESKHLIEITKSLMDDDYKRDALSQTLQIESAKLSGQLVNQQAVFDDQAVKRDYDLGKSLLQLSAKSLGQTEANQQAQAPQRSAVPTARPQQPQQ